MIALEKIPDQVGYLVIAEDGAVLASGGELENSEHVANVVTALLSLTDRLGPEDDAYKKLSDRTIVLSFTRRNLQFLVTYKDNSYVACLSNKKVYVVKKRYDADAGQAPPTPPLPHNISFVV